MKVHWYPGHMAKALSRLSDQLKVVDLVIEVRDARLPISSANSRLDEVLGHKPRIIVLNKVDLADQKALGPCLSLLKDQAQGLVCVDSLQKKGLKEVLKLAASLSSKRNEKRRSQGLLARPSRAMVVGIPNVGKSSLINALVRKAAAKTGNKPGVTRGNQWIRIANDIELLDTPGILMPRIDREEVGEFLAFTGAIKEEVFDIEEAAYALIDYLKDHRPQVLIEKYQLADPTRPAHELLEDIGRQAHYLDKKETIQWRRTAQKVLHDFKNGHLGAFTLDDCSQERHEDK